MRQGEVLESALAETLMAAPRHAYTRQLFGFGLRPRAAPAEG